MFYLITLLKERGVALLYSYSITPSQPYPNIAADKLISRLLGVGKTLIAEAVSKHLKRLLYLVY
jgi:hypothetical protein